MPSGKVHLRVETVLLVLCWLPLLGWLLALRRLGSTEAAAFVFAYAFSALFLSPDLDLHTSRPYLRWGVLRWLWAPYAFVFKHRKLSHHLLLGPLSRMAYLGVLVIGGAAIYVLVARRSLPEVVAPIPLLIAVLIGLYLPNLTHVILDRLPLRRRSRRRL